MSLSISVVIPAFNSEETIGSSLLSALQQTRKPKEIIVIDDASTDETRSVVRRIAESAEIPILLIDSEFNAGPGISRNQGWEQSSADLIAFLDADDLWHPKKLEVQVPLMESTPSIMMSCHDRTVGRFEGWKEINEPCLRQKTYGLRHFLLRNRCATPSVIVRRSISDRFSSSLRFSEDYYLWLSIILHYGPISFIDFPLVHCANPAYGGSGLSGRLLPMMKSEIRAYRLLFGRGELSLLVYPLVVFWSCLKFVVRLLDHHVLHDRLQRASETQ